MDDVSSTSNRGIVRKTLTTKDQYIAQRVKGAYLASICQPKASFDLFYAAQSTDYTPDDINLLNKRLAWQRTNKSRGLKYVQLHQDSLQIVVFCDTSFANNRDFSSQIGYVVCLTDKTDIANLIHWTSIKRKRMIRSVLAFELYVMGHVFDIEAVIKATVEKILDTHVPLILCTDSKSLYGCLVRLGTINEKRFMIDIMNFRQYYERREITEVKWIDGDKNPADAMAKAKAAPALKVLIDSNRIDLKAAEWIERQGRRMRQVDANEL